MGRLHQVKTNFTAGEVSRRLLGRGDLKAYDNGALALRNLFIDPTGGVTRRSGLAFTAPARGDGRLVAFERNTEQTYLLLFTGGWIDVFQGGARLASIAAPWTLAAAGADHLDAERRHAAGLPSRPAAAQAGARRGRGVDPVRMGLRGRGRTGPAALPPLRRSGGDAHPVGHRRGGHRHRVGPGLRPAPRRHPHPHQGQAVAGDRGRLADPAQRHGEGDAGRHPADDGLGGAGLLTPARLAGVGRLPSGPAGDRRVARPAQPAVAVQIRPDLELRPGRGAGRRGHRVRHPVRSGERRARRLLPAGICRSSPRAPSIW